MPLSLSHPAILGKVDAEFAVVFLRSSKSVKHG